MSLALQKIDLYTRQEIISKMNFNTFKKLRQVNTWSFNQILPKDMIPKKKIGRLALFENKCNITIERETITTDVNDWTTIEYIFEIPADDDVDRWEIEVGYVKRLILDRQDFEGAHFDCISLDSPTETLLEKLISLLEFGSVFANTLCFQKVPEEYLKKVLKNVFGVKEIYLYNFEYTPEVSKLIRSLNLDRLSIDSNSHDYQVISNLKDVSLSGFEEDFQKIHDLLTAFFNGKFKFPESLTLALKTNVEKANLRFLEFVQKEFPQNKMWIYDDMGKTVNLERRSLSLANRDEEDIEIFLESASSDDVIRIRETSWLDSENLYIDIAKFDCVPSHRH